MPSATSALVRQAVVAGSSAVLSPAKAAEGLAPRVSLVLLGLCITSELLLQFAQSRWVGAGAGTVWAHANGWLLSTILLVGFWFATGQFLRADPSPPTVLCGLTLLGSVAALYYLFTKSRPFVVLDLAVLSVATYVIGRLLRRDDSLAFALSAVALAGVVSTIGAGLGLFVAIYSGHTPTPVTLEGLAPAGTKLGSVLGRFELLKLWWAVIAAAALATGWQRSYRSALLIVVGCTIAIMLAHPAH